MNGHIKTKSLGIVMGYANGFCDNFLKDAHEIYTHKEEHIKLSSKERSRSK